jgi:manganese oxidase
MKKNIDFSDIESPDKRCKSAACKVETLSSKPIQYTVLVIAALCSYVASTMPAHAGVNVPTDMSASPLCIGGKCALEFTAKLLMFEEFGLKKMPSPNSGSGSGAILPSVADCQSMPNGQALDEFLSSDLYPKPRRQVEVNDDPADLTPNLPNAWDAKVRECVPEVTEEVETLYEGRPPGEWFAHQRWDEFFPKVYFQSAITGARVNGGLRDSQQLHGYNKGEFKPGGLYYPAGGTTAGAEIRMHPNLPVQGPYSVWTFDGTLPPKLLMARVGEPVLFRNFNALPIDESANGGFGKNEISTHEHNGHNPAESDGYAHAFTYPGQFYDYNWPMILAGYDTDDYSHDPRAGAPDGSGGIIPVKGDSRETASTHWFHDHRLDHTAENVYKGNAAMMNIYSAIDRGREPKDEEEASDLGKPGWACHYKNPAAVNLCLPSGSEMDWGNRDYDVNLLIADKAWDRNGQLKYNIFNTDGFLGDRITVNWVYKPYMEVRARRYRFRLLNGAVARNFKIAIVDQSGVKVPFYMVANDGNIMEHAVPFPNAQSRDALPEQGIAERYDIVIDFKGMEGKKLYMVNILAHDNGRGPKAIIPLANVLSGVYKANGKDGDPGVGKFLEFRVKGCGDSGAEQCIDYSMDPAEYVEGGKKMIPLNKATLQELQAAKHRTFEFGRSGGTDLIPWTIKTDGGSGLLANPHRLSAAPEIGALEIWHLKSGTGGNHPVHVHFEEAQILYRGGVAPPLWEKYARKDIFRVGGTLLIPDSKTTIDIALRVRDFAGTYVEHCHNTTHEDKAMLLRWDAQHPGQTLAIPTPEPGWEGVHYGATTTLPTYKTGDTKAKATFVLPPQ